MRKQDEPPQTELSTVAGGNLTDTPTGYAELLQDIKTRVQAARVRAASAVNSELVLLYWGIGRDILKRQQQQGWGAKVIERLASDLRREFPDMKGLSRTNFMYMRAFAEAWHDEAIVQQAAGQIPWFHKCREDELLPCGS